MLVLVLGVGAGFLLGRTTADTGPSSLADAATQTAKGDLPVGKLDLQQLLQAIGRQQGGSGILGQILGGNGGNGGSGSSGSGSGALDKILGGLLDQLQQRTGGGSKGSSSSGSSSSTAAFLGVRAQAAPTGQTGVLVAEVVAGSPAADAGLQAGDLVTAIDTQSVSSPAQLATAVQAHAPGDQVTIAYTRGGTAATAKARLGNASSTTTTTAPPANA